MLLRCRYVVAVMLLRSCLIVVMVLQGCSENNEMQIVFEHYPLIYLIYPVAERRCADNNLFCIVSSFGNKTTAAVTDYSNRKTTQRITLHLSFGLLCENSGYGKT